MLGWELPPHNSGGLGIACYQLCKALSVQNVDIEFILPYAADHGIDFMEITAANQQKAAGWKQAGNPYDSKNYARNGGDDLHFQQRLYEESVVRLIDEREFDIVHAHDWLTFRAALRVKERRGCPIVLHVHSVESDRSGGRHGGNPVVEDIESMSLHLADKIIAVSRHTKQAIVRDYGIPADKIEVIHNSIGEIDRSVLGSDNAYHYLTLMKELGWKVVVNVGRLTVQKGLPNLLKAAQQVVAREPKTLFLFVGNGEQYHELIEQSAELGIGANVLFADFQRGKKWRDAFAIGDLFVMPSVSEPFGLTPLEAVGYGTPVLISKQSGVSEVLKNALKVDYWDVDEMANKILAVLRDDVLRDELWQNAYREYQKLSWQDAGRKVRELYDKHLTEAPA